MVLLLLLLAFFVVVFVVDGRGVFFLSLGIDKEYTSQSVKCIWKIRRFNIWLTIPRSFTLLERSAQEANKVPRAL